MNECAYCLVAKSDEPICAECAKLDKETIISFALRLSSKKLADASDAIDNHADPAWAEVERLSREALGLVLWARSLP